MKRITAVGTCAMVALALSALAGAASASASGFMSGSYPTSLSASGGSGEIQMAGTTFNCTSAYFIGNVETTTGSFKPNSLAFPSCGGNPLQLNGCGLTFKPGAKIKAGYFGGTVDIGPPGCGPMTLKFYACGTYSIYPKSNLAAEFRNVGSGESAKVEIELNGTGLKYVPSSGCGSTGENGQLNFNWVMQSSSGGVHVGDQAGLFLSGEESGEVANQPQIEGEKTYQGILGEQTGESIIKGKITTICKQAEFQGEIAAPTNALPLEAVYGNCTSSAFPAKVKMNGCNYVLHVLNIGPPYVGDVDVVCSSGSAIEVLTYASEKLASEDKPICTTSIAAQSGIGAVSYTNFGSGALRRIAVDLNSSGITYTYTRHSATCPSTSGVYSDGSYSGSSSLSGLF